MTTQKFIDEYLNKTGTVELDGLRVDVKILDVRPVFGRVDVMITPAAGSGERWTDLRRIKIRLEV